MSLSFPGVSRIPGIGLAMSHLDALSYTNGLKFSIDEFAELRQGLWPVREKIQFQFLVLRYRDDAVVDPIVDPVAQDAELIGQLCHGEAAGSPAGARRAGVQKNAVTHADLPYGAGEHHIPRRGAEPRAGQPAGYLIVFEALAREIQDLLLHLRKS